MKQQSETKWHLLFPLKTMIAMAVILLAISMTFAFRSRTQIAGNTKSDNAINTDSVESVKAFMQVYKVLMSPACMNCHPAGDAPLQGLDGHPHTMNVKRGKDGTGLYAVKCSNCHQPQNTPGLHTPPGSPDWQLPPENMKMIFQGRTPHQLALQLMNYSQNGHKNKEQLIAHARTALVKKGWDLGEGRIQPPMSYSAFVSVWDEWINKGGYAPGK
jgi:mono/diheme cytochrome c family protein